MREHSTQLLLATNQRKEVMETGGIMSFTRRPRRPRYEKAHLSPKEAAILRVADAYGFSEIGAARLILRLRERQKIAQAKAKN